jgi:hypothetical protein
MTKVTAKCNSNLLKFVLSDNNLINIKLKIFYNFLLIYLLAFLLIFLIFYSFSRFYSIIINYNMFDKNKKDQRQIIHLCENFFLHFLFFGISGNLRRLRSVPPLPGRFAGTCSGVGQELKLEHESPTSLTTLSRPPLPDTMVPPPPGPDPPPPTDRPLLLSPPNKLTSFKDNCIMS